MVLAVSIYWLPLGWEKRSYSQAVLGRHVGSVGLRLALDRLKNLWISFPILMGIQWARPNCCQKDGYGYLGNGTSFLVIGSFFLKERQECNLSWLYLPYLHANQTLWFEYCWTVLLTIPYFSYTYEGTPGTIYPECQFVFDLELPEEFEPRVGDGEVQEFYLWPLDKVGRCNFAMSLSHTRIQCHREN